MEDKSKNHTIQYNENRERNDIKVNTIGAVYEKEDRT